MNLATSQHLSLWHYRTQNNIEVDFILEDRMGKLTGIEVKASATVDAKDFKALKHLQETEVCHFQPGIVLYAGREIVYFGSGLWEVPLSVWWAKFGPFKLCLLAQNLVALMVKTRDWSSQVDHYQGQKAEPIN